MKKKFNRYLSHRVLLLTLAAAAFFGCFLIAVAVCAVRDGAHALLAVTGAAGFAALCYAAFKWVFLPYQETKKILQLFVGGYTMQGIYDLRYPLSPEMEDAVLRLRAQLNTNELISATKKQAQYLALQNQINPHFLYNTLEGIRGEALAAGLTNVAEMTEALATFFRYTISNVEQLVTLEDELDNIESYYIIQQYRFGERLSLTVDCGDEDREVLYNYRLPKLTLQPIVENAIFHGIERKVGKGSIRIKVEATEMRLIITVSDDGLGIEPERLRELTEKLGKPAFDYVKPDGEKKGGIAIVNVNNRIRLLFGEEYGINIFSTVGIGTDVEINLPRITHDVKIKGA